MNIRRYREDDFQALARFYREFYNEMREWQGWEQLKLDEEEAATTARECLSNNSTVFVAVDHGKPVGFARIQPWEGAYFVREVFVEESARKKGVGSRLLVSCENFVRKKHETSVYLTVEPRHSVSIEYLVHNGYDTLNMLELRKDLIVNNLVRRKGSVEILGHKLRLLKRKI